MNRAVRKTAAIAVTVAALGAGAAVAASPASAAARPGTPAETAGKPAVIPRCAPSQVAAWVDAGSANGAAGSTYYHLDFTNISGTECHLYGYPGVIAVDGNGTQFGDGAVRNNTVAAQYVNLMPGASGHAILRYVDTVVAGAACKAKDAAFLNVIPPGDTTGGYAFFSLPTCSAKGQDSLQIERVQPGA